MNTKKVLLTGGRAPSTLELARLFFMNGYSVHIADSFPYALAKKSTAVEKFHLTRKPKQESEKFIEDLIKIIVDEQIDLLVPTCEEIFYIARFQDEIRKYCEVFVDTFEKMITLHHKFDFIKLAESFGMQVPGTTLITSLEEWKKETQGNKRSLIAKPVFSRFSSTVHRLPEERDLQIDVSEKKHWVLQEFIEGSHYCSYSVANRGKLLAHTTYKSEIRAGDGASIYFQHYEHEKIAEWVEVFVREMEFHGQIAFDFIQDEKGEVFAIECNPRLTSGVHLFRNTNLPAVFFENKSVRPNSDHPVSLKAALVLYGYQNIKLAGVKRFFQAFGRSRDVVFNTKDIGPFLYQWYSYLKIWELSRRNQISLLEATTYDISWDGD
ncbi:ATP-grasp domain-containing protein [Bacillus dakarensis]|uniref:ATP-grasp domain-containing protein n=1 Tax=Robertmurraya dakarensis TaxID=1926278 RepID=UPI0009822EEB|nr:ATP-grasp domain-containing protein [Bacillus dakarensis]